MLFIFSSVIVTFFTKMLLLGTCTVISDVIYCCTLKMTTQQLLSLLLPFLSLFKWIYMDV